MTEFPEHVRDLLEQRSAARETKDFARADALRVEIAALGYLVRDTADGVEVERAPTVEAIDPTAIPNTLSEAASMGFSVHVLYEAFPEDVERFLMGLERHYDVSDVETVVIDNASPDGERIHDIVEGFPFARALHLDREVGWAAARNAGLKTSKGRIVVLADLSVEPAGDVLSPLFDAFKDPSVAVAGPFGLVSDDMRSWRDAPGPAADAIEGYFLATRRELLALGLINERFKWYRNADIDLSFQLRSAAGGAPARVVEVPLDRHTHRGWDALDDDERAKRSKRNHYVFFDRWKHREDLLSSGSGVR